MESAQFEFHFDNVSPETNKLYVVETVRAITGKVVRMSGEAVETPGEVVETPESVVSSGAPVGRPPGVSSGGFTVRMPGEAVVSSGALLEGRLAFHQVVSLSERQAKLSKQEKV